MADPDDLAHAASDAVDAWRAEHPARDWPDCSWLGEIGFDRAAGTWRTRPTGMPRFTVPAEPVTVTYTRTVDPRERVQARLMLEGCTHDFQPRTGHWPEIVCAHCGVIVDEHGARFDDKASG